MRVDAGGCSDLSGTVGAKVPLVQIRGSAKIVWLAFTTGVGVRVVIGRGQLCLSGRIQSASGFGRGARRLPYYEGPTIPADTGSEPAPKRARRASSTRVIVR